MQRHYRFFVIIAGVLAFFLLSGFGLFKKNKKYDTPITRDTLQPDKVLFDRAIHDIEHGNFEVARLTLNTLINTYDTSEYLAKAKLAIADSWYREAGAHGLSQAEAEYKDFILFYPNMEEAAESQYKVCDIHFKQMEKADRDSAQAQHAEDECRQVMVQFPNSKYVPKAQQMLRETQEVLADKEFKTGDFYHTKGSFPAAANRMKFLAQQYPLYSGADDALWQLADDYKHMGDHFENDEADALTRIVRDYPLSDHIQQAKDMLTALKRPIPQADRAAYDRMKYDMDHYHRPGVVSRAINVFASRPDVSLSAKSGTPAMQSLRPPVPVSVPSSASGGANGVSDVSVSVGGDGSAIDRQPDARLGQPAPEAAPNGTGEQRASVGSNGQAVTQQVTPAGATPAAKPAADVNPQSLPTNHPLTADQIKQLKKQQEKMIKYVKKHPASAAAAGATAAAGTTATTPATTPAAATTPAPPK